jgi:hypothetical protein
MSKTITSAAILIAGFAIGIAQAADPVACTLVTPELIQSTLNLQVEPGTGTTPGVCKFKLKNVKGFGGVTVQLHADGKMSYWPNSIPSAVKDWTPVTGIGDQGIMTGPGQNHTYHLQFLKGSKMADLSIVSIESTPKPEQVKAFAKALVDKL